MTKVSSMTWLHKYTRCGRSDCQTDHKCIISTISVHHRSFAAAVKELSWCTPTDRSRLQYSKSKHGSAYTDWTPIGAFGVVAAMAESSRVIGINHSLPWKKTIVRDRDYFIELTRDKIVILGRQTLWELPRRRLSHISHASHAIVLSNTLQESDLSTAIITDNNDDNDNDPPARPLELSISRSFPEALDQARQIQYIKANAAATDMMDISVNDNHHNFQRFSNSLSKQQPPSLPPPLDCWVIGGERVYHEALLHPCASQLHLTVVNVDVNVHDNKEEKQNGMTERENAPVKITRFPPQYRWNNKFQLDPDWSIGPRKDEFSGLTYKINVYRGIKNRR